ncbi:DUF2247 family protein [Achromobacter seleniivolatilans]|uniref:DUF2247 family protein n=1 Tax=Achromobacter seleniivolatilans TaxID=3047478 RepID=A0ABY9M8I0_9BURK|nr:DUF2247 family protein [Achromobacter sp. R39]WMD22483.1 DUF2247 family protein [Achromobacter sp. R39]
MYFPVIPNSFICNYLDLCWRDVVWGYERKLVDWSFIVDLAAFYVSRGSVNPLEVDLICLGELDVVEIEGKLCALADHEGERDDLNSQKKWLFIALKWLFENKDDIADPLEIVELIYEDFDFPEEVENFVRYMPPQDGYRPGEHSAKENMERLFSNWNSYLEGAADYLRSENKGGAGTK